MNVVLPDQTAALLKWETRVVDGAWYSGWVSGPVTGDYAVCRLVPDQLVPLEELLTVECPLCHGTRSRQLYISGVLNNVMCENAYDRLTTCGNRGRIPLPEGDYRIGKVGEWSSIRNPQHATVVEPLASGVHLRQLEWEKVRRAPHAIVRERRWVQPNPPRVLWVRPDLYDELASHNPKGVLQIGEAT